MRKPFPFWLRSVGLVVLATCAVLLSACASPTSGVGYYWQSMTGHMHLMQAARPVEEWVADDQTPQPLRQRLLLSQRIRTFAVDTLGLPDNASYKNYADLKRRVAVYNVVAAPELSLELKQWCFPVVGCVGYRGYFDETNARAFAQTLSPDWEVAVYPVPAYSTLGWSNWLGGDPLLNTFIGYPEGELARLVFHELAHQVAFAAGDTAFNESFATAVERLGGERWLAQATPEAREQYQRFDARRQSFRALSRETRATLNSIYADSSTSESEKRAAKEAALGQFRERYAKVRSEWGESKGYDAWVARANNASFGAQAVYDDLVPAFEALFRREGQDFTRFYQAVQTLSKLSHTQRHLSLRALASDTRPIH